MTHALHILAYDIGVQEALEKLGADVKGTLATRLRKHLATALAGEHGELLTRIPMQAAMGGLAGAATGSLADKPLQGAGLGVLSGSLGGLGMAMAPKVRSKLIKQLSTRRR